MEKVVDFTGDYARGVVSGEIDACGYVRRACERHLSDLGREEFVFDVVGAGHVFRFFELLKHIKGAMAGQRFRLEPFQHFVLGSIFGWKHRHNGMRRFTEAYVEVPRKNGKSFLCSGVGLYGLVADSEGGPEIYSVATKIEQAKIVWGVATQMIRACNGLNEILRLRAHEILNDLNNGSFKALASDSKTLDGLNPHICVADELHAWSDSHLYSVIKDGMGARTQPLLLSITTAGASPTGICHEIRAHAIRVLGDEKDHDDRFFGYISTIDEGDKWDDERSWRKANPLLGSALGEEAFRAEAEQAKKIPSRKVEFCNVRLNMWLNSNDAWLDVERWRSLKGNIDENALQGRECYVGLDLSSTTDMTAMVMVFPDVDGVDVVIPRFYMPRKTIEKRSLESVNYYQHWLDRGHLEIGGDASISYDLIAADILSICKKHNVEKVCVDPWQAAQITGMMEEHGIPVVAVRQGYAHLNGACRHLEGRMADGKLVHDGNPCMSWHVNNVSVDTDPNGNIKPNKKKSVAKIDGVSALLTALAVIASENSPTYDDEYLKMLERRAAMRESEEVALVN